MATEKQINSRIIHKHDVESNWNKATTFIPKQGEIIIYDIDENYTYERMKIGDGKTTIINLPFVMDSATDLFNSKQDKLTGTEGQIITFDADGNVIVVDCAGADEAIAMLAECEVFIPAQ